MSAAVSDNQLRARPPALHVFGGIARLTFRRFASGGQAMVLLGVLALLTLLLFASMVHAPAGRFYEWMVDFYLTFFIPVMAFLSGAAALRDEMKPASADYVLTRPVRRSTLVCFKYLCQLACLQVFYLIVFVALTTLAISRGLTGLFPSVTLLFLAQAAALTAFSALGFLAGAITSRYLVLGLVYAVTIEFAIGRIPTPLNRISLVHQITLLAQPVLEKSPAHSFDAWALAALVLIFPTICLTLSSVLFSRREMADSPARDL